MKWMSSVLLILLVSGCFDRNVGQPIIVRIDAVQIYQSSKPIEEVLIAGDRLIVAIDADDASVAAAFLEAHPEPVEVSVYFGTNLYAHLTLDPKWSRTFLGTEYVNMPVISDVEAFMERSGIQLRED